MTDDFDRRVRDMMRTQATHAPDDYPVVQQVLHEVRTAPTTSARPRWRTWLVPLVAAGAVAAVAATVVGVENFRTSADHRVTVGNTGSAPAGPTSAGPAPSTSAPVTSVPAPAATVHGDPALRGYRVVDLTFVGDSAWALATTMCLSPEGCPYVVARSQGGGPWSLVYGPTMQWARQGSLHVRFATAQIGYVFGAEGFSMTTDGGRSWQQQPGAAMALETLDGNVIRLDSVCSPGCPVTVETAAVGSDAWTLRTLPGSQPGMTSGLSLVRVQGWSYLELYGHVAGGAQDATSRLFVSHDDGRSWTNEGEVCPQTGSGPAGSEVDSTAVAAGGGALAVVCVPRGGTRASVHSTSYQPAAAGTWPALPPLEAGTAGAVAVSGETTLLDTSEGLYRWAGAATAWSRVLGPEAGQLRWLGFESDTDARAVSSDGATVWTTHDAGQTWTPTSFP